MNTEVSSPRGRLAWVALLLAALAFGLYARTSTFEFLNYDDPDYVANNPVVARGLEPAGVEWAFGFHAANWHPLTWLAHMLDVEVFGLAPGPMHLVNAGLHALVAALLFLALAELTQSLWPSLLATALFAFHPLRVQCVAWIAERKELLAAVLFCAALLAYARYARTRKLGAYLAVVGFLALGLMAKPMLVTAPFVLLLLDVWPLRRFGAGASPARPAPRLVLLEKLPLLALSAAVCVLTLKAQSAGGAVGGIERFPLGERVLTAGAGVLAYLQSTLWPAGLAAFRPHPLLIGESVTLPGLLGLALAAVVTIVVWRARRAAPALFVGWCWFLGMLVPVLGLVQVGDQAWADRYAYLPSIGLALALVFGLEGALRTRPSLASGAALAGLCAAVLLAFASVRALPAWRSSRERFERDLEVTRHNWIAHNNLGLVYLERRETDRAREHFLAALRFRPTFVQARYNLGLAQEVDGSFDPAVESYRAALLQHPGHAPSLLRLAALARARGQGDEAVAHFEEATRSNRENPAVYAGFAQFLLERGEVDRASNAAESALKLDPHVVAAMLVLVELDLRRGEMTLSGERLARAEALAPDSADVLALRARWRMQKNDLAGARAAFERAILLDPSAARARHDFGALLLSSGDVDAAKSQFQALLDLRPGDPQALLGLATVALVEDEPARAVELLEKALQRLPGMMLAHINLGVAHERLGNWSKALENYAKSFKPGPPDPEAAGSAAWILATGPDTTLLDGEKAVELATYAAQRQAPRALEVLAAALARKGDFEKAVELQGKVVASAQRPEDKRSQEARLELYRSGMAFTRP